MLHPVCHHWHSIVTAFPDAREVDKWSFGFIAAEQFICVSMIPRTECNILTLPSSGLFVRHHLHQSAK